MARRTYVLALRGEQGCSTLRPDLLHIEVHMPRVALLLLSTLLAFSAVQQKGCDKQSGGSAGGAGASGGSSGKSGEGDPQAAERNVRRKVEDFRVALESRMARSVMQEVDPTNFSAYPGFEDQIQALLDATSELRLNFRIANVQVKPASGDKPGQAQVQVDAEMVYAMKSNPAASKRKSGQLQMDLMYSEAGWRFTKIEPRSFFTP